MIPTGIAVIHGEQKTNEDEAADGRNSPPMVDHSRIMDVGVGVPALAAKEKPPINVVGDVGGRIAIMVVSEIKISVLSKPAGFWDFVIGIFAWKDKHNI